MEASEHLVRQIISKSGIVSGPRRRELAAELNSHMEDLVDEVRAAGQYEGEVQEIVCQRFGNPEEIERAFADTYRTERIAAYAGILAALVVVSLAAVAVVISTLQLFIATWSGTTLSVAFSGMRWEAVGFLALTWGYVGIYIGERLFRQYRLVSAVTVNVFLFATAALGLHYLVRGHGVAAAVAYVCAGMVRILQRSNVRFIWCAGTAVPLSFAWLLAGPLVRSNSHLASWEVGLMVWLGMTLSCGAMTSITEFFDREIFTMLYLNSGNH
jgi:hypothetical protein